MKPSRGRPNPTANRRTYRAMESSYALAAPPGKSQAPIFAGLDPDKPHHPRTKPSGNPLESQVLQEIIAYLESRHDISAIVRTNSGVAVNDKRYTRFNTCLGKYEGEYMTLLDLQCIHKPSGRHIEIETKRATWRYTGLPNEIKQAARIGCIQECGGIAFFATCINDVKRWLPLISTRKGPENE